MSTPSQVPSPSQEPVQPGSYVPDLSDLAEPIDAPDDPAVVEPLQGRSNGNGQQPVSPERGREHDFISEYADCADVFELPKEAHEWIACQLIASILNGKVFIPWGEVTVPLDLWLLLFSGSGAGRNTIVDTARKIVQNAKVPGLIRKESWGSKQAFYQRFAENPRGLFVWPELSAVLRTLNDSKFGGVKEWITDRYDNLFIPDAITYRETGKKGDTPPIEFAEAPRTNILATSSFDWLLTSLHETDTTGGFIPRWLMVRLPNSGRSLPKPRTANPELIDSLGEKLKAISGLAGPADLSEVEEMYGQWYRDAQKRFEAQLNRALADPFFNRLRNQVLKLAVVFEISQSCSLKVSERAMQRAIDAARLIEQNIFHLLPMGMSREGAEVQKIADLVDRAGSGGLCLSEITTAFKHWNPQERERRLRTLIQAETIACFERSTKGRTALVFVGQKYLADHVREFPGDKRK